MSELAQVVAAVAAGSLITLNTMLVVKVHHLKRKTARDQRIQDAVRITLDATETFRLQERATRPPADEEPSDTAPGGHLRLVPAKATDLPIRKIHPQPRVTTVNGRKHDPY